MSSRIRSFSKLVLELDSALKAFQSSDAKFRVLKTVYPPSRSRPPRSGKSGVHGYGDVTTTTTTIPSALSSRGEGGEERAKEGEEPEEEEEYEEDLSSPLPPPKTLFILDSSFNPPSIAHAALAQSAFLDDCNSSSSQPSQPSQQQKEKKEYEFPHRLLLLFAVTNADKIAAPASFEHRLAMMTCFARDLQDFFARDVQRQKGQEQEQEQKEEQKQHKNENENEKQKEKQHPPMAIDIGVTKYPFYTDKSRAIESEQGQKFYPTNPRHIHLLGYDTLTRIFTAKYYIQQDFNPPFAALQPYFDKGYELRVTLRPDSTSSSAGPASSVKKEKENEKKKEDQKTSFLSNLTDPQGEMQKNGAQANWARQIEFVSPQDAEMGVSSTRIREAVKRGEWEIVRELCTPRVARWVEREGLYLE